MAVGCSLHGGAAPPSAPGMPANPHTPWGDASPHTPGGGKDGCIGVDGCCIGGGAIPVGAKGGCTGGAIPGGGKGGCIGGAIPGGVKAVCPAGGRHACCGHGLSHGWPGGGTPGWHPPDLAMKASGAAPFNHNIRFAIHLSCAQNYVPNS